jgi:glutamate-1-semialdehyde 2,1-aminomutase
MKSWVVKILENSKDVSRYAKSEEQLKRAEQTIPLGSQTFSKSRTQYPVGISPLYAARAKGAEIWDVDGNKYIDLVSSLASITLGYGDSEVNKAVKKQLRLGVSLSLPARLEAEVSELIVEMVPSAEMVRFGKNGSDATSAAIRLARAFTGRDHIIVCGYHGWQDWYIGSTTRDKGVPSSVSSLTHKFEFNDIESLKQILVSWENEVAAVIMEPMNANFPNPGFLEQVQSLTSQAGALLIFDETITGFRYAKGGAQELFGVTPDLSTFGKGMANGFPLSAVVGRRDVMLEMEEIFFSGTFGGELLSLAAAKVVLERHLKQDLCGKLFSAGQNLSNKAEMAIAQNGLEGLLKISGHPTWRFLNWTATEDYSVDEIRTYFMQEVFKRGLLVLSTHNVTLAHTPSIIDGISDIYTEVFGRLNRAISDRTLQEELKVSPLKPLFKVR